MMSKDELIGLNNEKALNTLIAEQLIGWQLEKDEEKIKRLNGYLAHDAERRWWRMPNGGWYHKLPAYSTDIAATWQVVESLNNQGYKLHLTQNDFDNNASFALDGRNSDYITEKSVPAAICKAALQIVLNSVVVTL